ncbi:uncharacterized protein [Argopecten irradians]|uniref:uncharacterized protein n=1 Tax=Argopecten irradians TaxID=31199 RepID=UPI003712C9EC
MIVSTKASYRLVMILLSINIIVLVVEYKFTHANNSKRENQKRQFANISRPKALESYLLQHMSDNGQRTKYLVYECARSRETPCYGWSDRIAGIVTTFIISILSNRHFLIHFDTPCLLQDYLIPNHYDWRYNSSILVNKTSSFHDIKNWDYKKIDKYISGGSDFNEHFRTDIVFLLINWDFISEFRKRPNIANDIPWISQFHQSDIYKDFYKFLFKLTNVSGNALAHHEKTRRKRKKIACAHVRIGRNPTIPQDTGNPVKLPLDVLWKYFDSVNRDEFDFFVASDSDSVKTDAKKRYPDNVIDTPGKITHIDQHTDSDPADGFLKQLLDFYILMRCDKLIISENSGFGMLAAFIRNTNYELYCWVGRDLIPCSRYTVNDIMPIGKFGIKPVW